MSGFLTIKRTMGCKIESTPYTAETLAVTDYVQSAYNINYDPDVAMYMRKLARGDASRDAAIAGKRKIKISFSIDVAVGSAAATPPQSFIPLRACGMKQTTHGSTGVSLVTHSGYFNVPMTIEVVEMDEGTSPVQLVLKARGCMGNAKLITNGVGLPKRIDFDFDGVLVGITDRAFASQIVPTGFDAALPQAVLACTTSLFAETQYFDKITIDLGNKVELWGDSTKAEGIEGARIVDREPTIEIDPAMSLIATNSQFARQTGNTLGAYSETIGGGTIPITISAPKAQIIQAYKPGEREGRVTNQVKCILTRNLGNDELKILQGAE
jgi:hypothetical protein